MILGAEESKALATESLVDVAKHCIRAIHHAPQITGRVKVKTAILTGEALEPVIEVLEAIGEHQLVLWMDGLTYRTAYDEGNPPVLLLIGADLTKSQSGWDCGACGFSTCKEFNKYSSDNYGLGLGTFGPSCMMNVLDFGIMCDYGCAAASKNDTENRIHVSVGLVGLLLDILPECSYVLGLSLGPLKELWYYNRPAFTKIWDKEWNRDFWEALIRQMFPLMFQTFCGQANPPIKTMDKWWEQDDFDYVKVGPDPELNQKYKMLLPKALSVIPGARAKIEALKEKAARELDPQEV